MVDIREILKDPNHPKVIDLMTGKFPEPMIHISERERMLREIEAERETKRTIESWERCDGNYR